MWLTFSWRKLGVILVCGYRKTWVKNTEYWMSIGCTGKNLLLRFSETILFNFSTASGDQIVFLKMPKKLLSTKWAYQTTICGCIRTSRYCTCQSKLILRPLVHNYPTMDAKMFLMNSFSFYTFFRLTLVLSCAMKFESYPHDTQVCSMMIESCT